MCGPFSLARRKPPVPLHHPTGGPPPPAGEDRLCPLPAENRQLNPFNPLDSKSLSSDISVMTEIRDTSSKLSPAATEFILHWAIWAGNGASTARWRTFMRSPSVDSQRGG